MWETASARAGRRSLPSSRNSSRSTSTRAPAARQELTYYRLKFHMEQAAAFLETRRYPPRRRTNSPRWKARPHNAADKRLYTVMASDRHDRRSDEGSPRMTSSSSARRRIPGRSMRASRRRPEGYDGPPIASNWVATSTKALVVGHANPEHQGAVGGQVPHRDGGQSGQRPLLGGHAHAVHRKRNSRPPTTTSPGPSTWIPKRWYAVFSAPAGGEEHRARRLRQGHAHAYITANVQHPGAEASGATPPRARVASSRFHQRGAGLLVT